MKKLTLAISSILLAASTYDVQATNGYFAHGYSSSEKGTAGAGVAWGRDSLATATNPANLMHLDERMDLGFSIFNPNRSYTVTGDPSLPAGFTPVIGGFPGCANPGIEPCQVPFSQTPGKVDSGRNYFVIPSFGMTLDIDETSKWGIALYGNGGMNTRYSDGSAVVLDPNTNSMVELPGTFGAGEAGVDLAQLFVNATYAWQMNESVDFGVSFIYALQAFEATGLANFQNISLDATKLTNNGHDMSHGYGFKLGTNIALSDAVTLGISYQSEMEMSDFDDYAGLFAEGGGFNIPSTYTVGIAWNTSDSSTLLLDYQTINYSDIDSIANGISPLLTGQCVDALNNTIFNGMMPTPASGAGCLGGANGAGFGWNDVDVIKLGYEWKSGTDTWRLGYSTTDQPIDSSEVNFNILAPGVVEDHFTVGYTTKMNDTEMTFHFMYAPNTSVTGQSSFDPGQTIELEMDQFEVGVSFRF